MNIIIAGAGKVGYNLAKILSYNHNIYIIDKNTQAIDKINETLDVMSIYGDVKDPKTYYGLQNIEFDIFIAVTNSDETNILSTIIAQDILSIQKTIIRLINGFFANSTITKKLSINKTVFPNKITANSIESLLNYPNANNIKKIPSSDFKLISVRAKEPKIKTYGDLELKNFAFVGFERENKFYLAKNQEIKQNDLIYFIAKKDNIVKICSLLNKNSIYYITNVAILGINSLTNEILEKLTKKDLNIKVIEKDLNLCNKLLEKFQDKITVINSKYNQKSVLKQENIDEAHLVVSTYENDENNIVNSLLLKELGVKKVVAINNDLEFYNLMHKLNIITIRGPKYNAYNHILEYLTSNDIINIKTFCGNKGVFFVKKIKSRIKIKDLALGKFFIIRAGNLIQNINILEDGDIVIFFTEQKNFEKSQHWIYKL